MRLSVTFLFAALVAACRSNDAKPTDPAPAPIASESAPVSSASAPTMPAVAVTETASDAGADADADAMADASPDAGESPPGCPPDMAKAGSFCVDRWEGTLSTKSEDGVLTPWPYYERPEKNTYYVAMSAPGNFPQAYISRVEAEEACGHAGKRLCGRAEWIRACKGRRGFRYPYGNKGQRNVCNSGKIHLLEKLFGPRPRSWTYEAFNDPKLDREPGFLAMTGEYQACQTDEGVFDMVGNLHEWVRDNVASNIEIVMERDQVDRKSQPWKIGNGIFMGGFYSTTSEHGPGCAFTTIAHEPQYHDYSTGFRCCMDAPSQTKKSGSSQDD